MIKQTRLPQEIINGEMAWKFTLEGIDEIQYLYVAPKTCIKMHGHDRQWEVWVRLSDMTAYICLIGEQHELQNNTDKEQDFFAIKGHIDYSYEDLAELCKKFGCKVYQGSIKIDD